MADESARPVFPFTAIVGQEAMRLALLLNAVDPLVGGVLIRGEKGTAKSTMARSLAELLPEQRVLAGCAYGCDPDGSERCADHRAAGADAAVRTRRMPVVELPGNADESRVVGTLDVGAALSGGGLRFEPGLLAAAHRGVLYIDEVNLLPDHIVDLVLDAAAMGWNAVEREGVSVAHPARFILVGTMNPEEGDLRPQLLDRFGLCVEVSGIASIEERVEVMRRREAYDADPAAFARAWVAEQERLRRAVTRARSLLRRIEPSEEVLRTIAALSLELGVDGHRADLVMLRAARALAALEGRTAVTREDVRRAAELATRHRLRRRPFEQERFSESRLEEALARAGADGGGVERGADEGERDETDSGTGPAGAGTRTAGEEDGAATPPDGTPEAQRPPLPPLLPERERGAPGGNGRRLRAAAETGQGRAVRAVPAGPGATVAVAATVRAAAGRVARSDGITPDGGAAVRPEDLRRQVRERALGATIVFLVDLSGSMRARRRLEAARGAALTLLTEAYERRDRVALIAFRGASAEVVLPPTGSVELVQERLGELAVGGRTPLAAGLRGGLDLVRQVRLKDRGAVCVLVLLTDGRANVAADGEPPVESALATARGYQQPGVHLLVLDTEDGAVRLGLAARVAEAAGGRYVRLADLSAESVAAEARAAALAASE